MVFGSGLTRPGPVTQAAKECFGHSQATVGTKQQFLFGTGLVCPDSNS